MRHLVRHIWRGGTKTVPASVVLAAMLPATLAYWVVHANIAGVVLGALYLLQDVMANLSVTRQTA